MSKASRLMNGRAAAVSVERNGVDSCCEPSVGFDLTVGVPRCPDFPYYPPRDIGGGLIVQRAWVFPEMAARWLGHRGFRQRPRDAGHVDCIARNIREGLWMLNGEAIILDSDGNLADGQSRCEAIVKANQAAEAVIVFDIPPDAARTLGNQRRYSGSNALAALGYEHTNILQAAVTLLKRYEFQKISVSGVRRLELSTAEYGQIVEDRPAIVASLRATLKFKSSGLGFDPSAAVFCHYVFAGRNREQADDFMGRFATGANLHERHPILTLRNKLSKDDFHRDIQILFAIKAWNCFRRGKDMTRLTYQAEEQLPEVL